MVDINDLDIGTKVRIVDEWCRGCHENDHGKMDHWLGSIMTVREIVPAGELYPACAKMEEDAEEWDSGWSWFSEAIAEIVYAPEIEPTTEEELFGFLLG